MPKSQARLACAVRAEKSEDGARADGKIDVVGEVAGGRVGVDPGRGRYQLGVGAVSHLGQAGGAMRVAVE
jgi:hypothetical protein